MLTQKGSISKQALCQWFPEVVFAVLSKFICDLLLNSPKLSLQFPCKQVLGILLFILDDLLCMFNCFVLITKQPYYYL